MMIIRKEFEGKPSVWYILPAMISYCILRSKQIQYGYSQDSQPGAGSFNRD
jgi:hypothetical protein